MKQFALGVDVGGSHVSSMIFDLKHQVLLPETSAESDLDNHGTPEEIIAAWGNVIKKSLSAVDIDQVEGIGFAMPGPYDYAEGISLLSGKNGKYENTHGMKVPEMLRSYLLLPEDFKVRFINDATAFALGEDQVGKAKEVQRSLSITLGTGFGSAFIEDGIPLVDGDKVPENGCLWHVPFEGGIADDYFSTRGLLTRYKALSERSFLGVKEIAEWASKCEEAQAVFTDFGQKMGELLVPWIKKIDLEMLVIGGNISKAFHLFGPSLQGFLNKEGLGMDIAISELKENAAIIGSATLVDDTYYLRVLPVL